MTERRRLLALASGCLFGMLAKQARAQQAGAPRLFDPVGRWRFFHTDGTPFVARLLMDGTATTNWSGGERGIWRWERDAVRILYTDGWDDLLSANNPADAGFIKRGWAPEANRCGPPSNQTAAERLSADLGPPL